MTFNRNKLLAPTVMSVTLGVIAAMQLLLSRSLRNDAFVDEATYIVSGQLRAQLKGQAERIYKAGDTFYEPTKSLHRVSRNPSDKTKTRLLAILQIPREVKEIVIPEPEKK